MKFLVEIIYITVRKWRPIFQKIFYHKKFCLIRIIENQVEICSLFFTAFRGIGKFLYRFIKHERAPHIVGVLAFATE